MAPNDILAIVRLVLLWAIPIGVVTWVLQRLLRRYSLLLQLLLVVLATVAVLLAGMLSAFNAMFISAHDLEVMWYIVAVASVLALVVSVLLGLAMARNTSRLVGIARSIGRGEAVAPERAMNSELEALSRELHATSERLEDSRRREAAAESSRRQLVSWVSHDLRTPLASMKAMTEALEDGVVTDVSAYHRKIISQADQMSVLVNDLLELSKIQAGTLVLRPENVDLYDLVSDAIADLAPVATQRSITIDGSQVRTTLALADAPSLARAVRNLLLNAIVYTHQHTTVRIGARTEGTDAVISVEDECGGIPEQHLNKLFTAGWQERLGRSRTEFSGAGIGLSLVSGIAQAHGGSVDVGNVGPGCRFTLRVPGPADGLQTVGA